jgi:diguanylate cyclase (GGDEF)-like protein
MVIENIGAIRRILKGGFFRKLMFASLAMAVVLPVYDVLFIYPSIRELLMESTREDAIRVARHLASQILSNGGNLNRSSLQADFLNEIGSPQSEFDLAKLKVFSESGEVVFSTDSEDIGSINSEPYFSQIVAQGQVHAKIVRREQESLEGQIMTADVVETYVPLMVDGVFRGAFEIYYDITDKRDELDGLLSRSTTTVFTLSSGLLALILFTWVKENRILAQRQLSEEKIHYLAHHDGVTDLPNRLMFKEHLDRALSHAARKREMVAVLFLDLDNFKRVNDTLGHQTGDLLLKAVADRLVGIVRDSDVLTRHGDEWPVPSIARFGGDEFVLLLTAVEQPEDAAKVSRRIFDALSRPFSLDGHSLTVKASIGISLYPTDGLDFDTLIGNADKAMYSVKNSGRNNYRFHSF